MFIACVVAMTLSLGVEGLYFFARDAVTQNLPHAFFVSDCAWLLGMLAIPLVKRVPIATLLLGWVSALIIAIELEPMTNDHSFQWFVARNSLLILYLVAAHGAAYIALRRRTTNAAAKTVP